MKQENAKNQKNTVQEMQKLMSSAEGKQLLSILSQGGGLQAAMTAFRRGDMNGVKEALQPALQTKEAEELLQKINEK
ncbi:MAG: hypothetical protein J6K89_06970 [Oscillospiraceae bacterium]|nr:hypothetical protein [Oscillospiraceae bacterium]